MSNSSSVILLVLLIWIVLHTVLFKLKLVERHPARLIGFRVGRVLRFLVLAPFGGVRILWRLISQNSVQADSSYGFMPRWSRFFFIRKWFRRRGIVVDSSLRRLSESVSQRHVLVCAPSGAGKSTRVIIQQCLAVERADHTLILTDPSGEIWRATSGYLYSKGMQIRALNLSDPSLSILYNPLARCETKNDALQLARILIDSAYPSQKGDIFWTEAAVGFLGCILTMLRNGPAEYRNLANAYRLILKAGSDIRALDDPMSKYADEDTFASYASTVASPEKVFLSIVATARVALQPLSNPILSRLTSDDSLDIACLRESPSCLYVIIEETELKYYSFLLNCLYTQLFTAFSKSQDDQLPAYVLLDEFAHTRIPNFPLMATTLRKRGVSLLMAIQSTGQLDAAYTPTGARIIREGGSNTQIFFPGLPHSTCVEISHMLGRNRRDSGIGKVSASAGPLMAPEEIRTLPEDRALLVSTNRQPVLLRTKPYFRNRRLKKRAELPPVDSFPETVLTGQTAPEIQYMPLPSPQRQTDGRSTANPGSSLADHSGTEKPADPVPTMDQLSESVVKQVAQRVCELTGPALKQSILLNQIGSDAVVPMTDLMEALGISRDVADRLRNEGKLRPVVTKNARNSRLYVSIGHARNLCRQLKEAPIPSKRRSMSRTKPKK